MVAKDSLAYPTLAVIQHMGLEPYAGELYTMSHWIGSQLLNVDTGHKVRYDEILNYLDIQIGADKLSDTMGMLVENVRRAMYSVAGYVKDDLWLRAGVPIPTPPFMLYS